MTSEKVDVRRTMPELYAPRNRDWKPVTVPELTYLSINGAGDPNVSERYASAVAALYSVAYPLKFTSKRELGRDYVVPPLEGLWYADDPSVFVTREKASFQWTMLILLPEWITQPMVETSVATAHDKDADLPHDDLVVRRIDEDACLQMLYVGSYDDEGPALHRLHHEVMPQAGLTFNGHHHEIYLSDPRRTAPERLRTILRQPVRPSGS